MDEFGTMEDMEELINKKLKNRVLKISNGLSC